MDLSLIKNQIVTLKLELVTLKIEKSEMIQKQDYLKATDLREKEHLITEELNNQKIELENYLHSLETNPSKLVEIKNVLNVLMVFNKEYYK